MAEEIKTGDVVKLKSGGPKMTADMHSTTGIWSCKWFVGEDLHYGDFESEALEKVE
jgi:uncharacterized protein YodC (DUF2158 family)